MKVRGLDLRSSAFYTTLPPLAMVVCSLLGGVVSDFLTKSRGKRLGRCGVGVIALVLAAMFLVLGSRAESARVASFVLSGGAGALYLSQSSYWSVTTEVAGASAGSASGFMRMGAQLGGALTSSLTPAIALRYGWTTSFLVAAVLSLMGAMAWLIVDPDRQLAPGANNDSLSNSGSAMAGGDQAAQHSSVPALHNFAAARSSKTERSVTKPHTRAWKRWVFAPPMRRSLICGER